MLQTKVLPGSVKNKRTAREYYRHISSTVREYNNKSIAREYYNPKYCQEVPHTKVRQMNATIKGIPRSIIIKATARECQIQNDDRECINQKNCHGVPPIKISAGKIRITIQSATKEYHNQNGLQCESTVIDYRIGNDCK